MVDLSWSEYTTYWPEQGEPPEAANVYPSGGENYPDDVIAWMNIYMAPDKQNKYACLFANSPKMLDALKKCLDIFTEEDPDSQFHEDAPYHFLWKVIQEAQDYEQ